MSEALTPQEGAFTVFERKDKTSEYFVVSVILCLLGFFIGILVGLGAKGLLILLLQP